MINQTITINAPIVWPGSCDAVAANTFQEDGGTPFSGEHDDITVSRTGNSSTYQDVKLTFALQANPAIPKEVIDGQVRQQRWPKFQNMAREFGMKEGVFVKSAVASAAGNDPDPALLDWCTNIQDHVVITAEAKPGPQGANQTYSVRIKLSDLNKEDLDGTKIKIRYGIRFFVYGTTPNVDGVPPYHTCTVDPEVDMEPDGA